GDFVAEKDGKMIPVSGNERITKAFWNILSDYGARVGVVNWWVTWPPDKVNGYMVSDRYRNGKPKAQRQKEAAERIAERQAGQMGIEEPAKAADQSSDYALTYPA